MMNKKLARIKVIAMDVDGVMTDGRIIYDGSGKELKFFDVQDGYGIACARRAGFMVAMISARACPAVRARARDLKFDAVYLNAASKVRAYARMLKKFKVTDDQVCFIGDDLPDHPVLRRVGVAVAVTNAAPEIKQIADYVTRHPGGRGAVREVMELILKAHNLWGVA